MKSVMVIAMEAQTETTRKASGCFGYKLSFHKETSSESPLSINFGAPFFETAKLVEFKIEDLHDVLSLKTEGTSSYIVVLENGNEQIRSFELWVREEPKVVELNLRNVRVLWSARRSLLITGESAQHSALQGVTYLTFVEAKLVALLQQMQQSSRVAQADIPLTHQVSESDLAKRAHVNEMTKLSWSARLQHAGIDACLHLYPDDLSLEARRVVVELANTLNMSDRLEILDDQIEILEDLYELANDRLSEYAYYRSEFKLELWIIVILIVEAGIMLVEALTLAHHG